MRRSGVRPRDVEEFLLGLSPGTRRLVMALREVVRNAAPGAAESLLWGGLSYHRPWIGGRVKGAVCQISAKAGAVKLEFIHGAHLSDRAGLLAGACVSKRFVRIHTVAEARRPEVAALIREAAALEFVGPA